MPTHLKSFADLKDLLRHGLGKSLISLLIKVATAGLTYLMYVILSRTMGATEYGYFAFGLSLATILAIGASMGQQTAILRYWPEAIGAGRPEKAMTALRAGASLTVVAGFAVSVALVVLSFVFAAFFAPKDPILHLYASAALVLPLSASEYFSSALRAQGSVWSALVPRDILWRIATPALVVLLFAVGVKLSGWEALLLTAALLALALGLQFVFARVRHYALAPSTAGLGGYWRQHGAASLWFLSGTVIDSAALNIDIILVGLFVTAESAGVYFNAFRTAGLLTLFMFAITLVIAPMVAQHYHAGEMRKAQAVTALCAWAGFLFSAVVFAGFVLFGDQVMGLFGENSADGKLLLIILSVGLLFDAATGPTRIVMMMTGHERDYVRIFGSIMLASMLAQVVLIPMFGLVAAAVVNMLARMVAQIAIAWWSRQHIGIDTTLLGVLLINRQRDIVRAVPAE